MKLTSGLIIFIIGHGTWKNLHHSEYNQTADVLYFACKQRTLKPNTTPNNNTNFIRMLSLSLSLSLSHLSNFTSRRSEENRKSTIND